MFDAWHFFVIEKSFVFEKKDNTQRCAKSVWFNIEYIKYILWTYTFILLNIYLFFLPALSHTVSMIVHALHLWFNSVYFV